MKKLMISAALVALVASPAAAQDAGDLGLFFDNAGNTTTVNAVAFQPIDVFALAFDIGEISAFEFEIMYAPGATNGGRTWLNKPANSGDPGAVNFGSDDNYIVGLGACFNGQGWLELVKTTFFWFSAPPADFTFCLGPAGPSSVSPPAPAFVDCNDGLGVFGVALNGSPDYDNGCAVVNPTGEPPVATESSSMGALKASF